MVTIKQRASKFDGQPSTFGEILARSVTSNVNAKQRQDDSVKWFQDQARKTKVKPSELMRQDKTRLKNNLRIGDMGFFFYDPKHKKTLPYYDTFPLVLKIEDYEDGFLGLNFHYLPYVLRAKLMDALFSVTNNKKYDESTKLLISYDILKSAAKFSLYKPCVKRYLTNHVRSRFLKIYANEWDMALFLPVHNFEKATATKVWQDSRGKI